MPPVNPPLNGDIDFTRNRVRTIGGVRLILGGSTSGAPTTGHHFAGEFFTDKSGNTYACSVSGTPGTWVQQPVTILAGNMGATTVGIAGTSYGAPIGGQALSTTENIRQWICPRTGTLRSLYFNTLTA